MEKNTIGLFLAALRKANGLTQRQLADKLCVSDKAISRWERDEALPDLTLIPVIAEIFGITSDELLRGQRSTESAPSSHNAYKTEKAIPEHHKASPASKPYVDRVYHHYSTSRNLVCRLHYYMLENAPLLLHLQAHRISQVHSIGVDFSS